MKYIHLIVLFFAFGVAGNLFAQCKIDIVGEAELQNMLLKRIAAVDTTSLSGYRIQLYFGNNRNDAQTMQAQFNSRYPEWSNESYLLYYDPSWRLRIGNFYRKIDAQPMMKILQSDFGNVFLIRDKIELPELRLVTGE